MKDEDAKLSQEESRIEYIIRLEESYRAALTECLAEFETVPYARIPYIGVRVYSQRAENELHVVLDAIPGITYHKALPRRVLGED